MFMSYGQGERNSLGTSISLKWGERSVEGYPSKSLKSKGMYRLLWCPRCCGLGAVL